MSEDKENDPNLKKLISIILELQEVEERFIDLAKDMRYGNDNGKAVKKTNKSESDRDKEKGSRIRSFLNHSKNNDQNAPVQKDQLSINRKIYVLGYPDKE
jgi:hypothetical protein